jgi:hypothetical protein
MLHSYDNDSFVHCEQKAILPTILSNLKRAREADSNEENKKVSAMPSEKIPTNSNDA